MKLFQVGLDFFLEIFATGQDLTCLTFETCQQTSPSTPTLPKIRGQAKICIVSIYYLDVCELSVHGLFGVCARCTSYRATTFSIMTLNLPTPTLMAQLQPSA